MCCRPQQGSVFEMANREIRVPLSVFEMANREIREGDERVGNARKRRRRQ
eukprot:COSAG06_NODE_8767_length_2076_cov_1.267071_3_plen_50_part_00